MAGDTEPSDPAYHKREHPSRPCLDHARLPSGWRMRGCQEEFASDFLFILGQDCSLSFPPAFGSRGGSCSRGSGNPPAWEVKMAACHACPFPVWATGSGLGFSFPLFLGVFHTKTGRHEECLFHACLCYACIPSMVLGIPHPSQVSLLGTGHRRDMPWGPSSVHISGECFHLPNPSPMICPQRGTKGLLTAQI